MTQTTHAGTDDALRPTMVAVLFREELGAQLRQALEGGEAGPVQVRQVRWADPTAVRRAKASQSRSAQWVRAHEQHLDEAGRGALAEAEVLLALDVPIDLAALAPNLRFVQAIGAGVGQLVAVLRGSRIHLCSAAGLSSDKIAEFVMARILGVWADLRHLDELQRARRWDPDDVRTEPFAGRTVLVVGAGGIGQAVARRAAGFDLRCIGIRRRPELGLPAGFSEVAGPDALRELLARADAVVLAAPATRRTQGLIGAAELAAMKPSAVLCNVARGALVDEEALVAALEAGHLGAAVLDVATQEPLSRRSPLWKAPRTYISPHVANAWRPEYLASVAGLLAENIGRARRGEPLRNEVDLDEGY